MVQKVKFSLLTGDINVVLLGKEFSPVDLRPRYFLVFSLFVLNPRISYHPTGRDFTKFYYVVSLDLRQPYFLSIL